MLAATMQNLLSKFSNLSVNTESKHPTVTDSARIDTTLFDKDTPSSASTQRAEMPLVTDVVFKHSSAFNSERASGMSKLEQLQFVEMMKKNIVGKETTFEHRGGSTAEVVYRGSINCLSGTISFPHRYSAQKSGIACQPLRSYCACHVSRSCLIRWQHGSCP
jgi:hypothetical protein